MPSYQLDYTYSIVSSQSGEKRIEADSEDEAIQKLEDILSEHYDEYEVTDVNEVE